MLHREIHLSHRAGWLRAAVLGASDGITSVAALVLGVSAATSPGSTAATTAGLAGLVGGALSMAAGEYMSVSSQRDSEQADIAKEKHELATVPERELAELTGIYQHKGLPHDLARQVAIELSKGDALKVHLEEELGLSESNLARPLQAGATSAASFALGAALPLLAIAFAPASIRAWVTFVVALVSLGLLGGLGARLGGAPVLRATIRVLVGGILAMGVTVGIGHLFGTDA